MPSPPVPVAEAINCGQLHSINITLEQHLPGWLPLLLVTFYRLWGVEVGIVTEGILVSLSQLCFLSHLGHFKISFVAL